MAISAETQAIIDKLTAEGKLIRNDGRTNSIKTVNVRLDKFAAVFSSIDVGIGRLNETISQMVGNAAVAGPEALGLDQEYIDLQREAAELQIENAKDEAVLNKRELAEKIISQKKAEDARRKGEAEDKKLFKGGIFNALKDNKLDILKYGLIGYAGWQIFRGAMDNLTEGGFSEVLGKAGDAFKEFVGNINWKELGENLADGITKLGDLLSGDGLKTALISLAGAAAVFAIAKNVLGGAAAGVGGAAMLKWMNSGGKGAMPGLPKPEVSKGMLSKFSLGKLGLAGLALGAVSATLPFVKDAIRENIQELTPAEMAKAEADTTGLDVAGMALQGASIGMMFGPKGALVGAVAGATVGLGMMAVDAIQDAMDETGSVATQESNIALEKVNKAIKDRAETAEALKDSGLTPEKIEEALNKEFGVLEELQSARERAIGSVLLETETQAALLRTQIEEYEATAVKTTLGTGGVTVSATELARRTQEKKDRLAAMQAELASLEKSAIAFVEGSPEARALAEKEAELRQSEAAAEEYNSLSSKFSRLFSGSDKVDKINLVTDKLEIAEKGGSGGVNVINVTNAPSQVDASRTTVDNSTTANSVSTSNGGGNDRASVSLPNGG